MSTWSSNPEIQNILAKIREDIIDEGRDDIGFKASEQAAYKAAKEIEQPNFKLKPTTDFVLSGEKQLPAIYNSGLPAEIAEETVKQKINPKAVLQALGKSAGGIAKNIGTGLVRGAPLAAATYIGDAGDVEGENQLMQEIDRLKSEDKALKNIKPETLEAFAGGNITPDNKMMSEQIMSEENRLKDILNKVRPPVANKPKKAWDDVPSMRDIYKQQGLDPDVYEQAGLEAQREQMANAYKQPNDVVAGPMNSGSAIAGEGEPIPDKIAEKLSEKQRLSDLLDQARKDRALQEGLAGVMKGIKKASFARGGAALTQIKPDTEMEDTLAKIAQRGYSETEGDIAAAQKAEQDKLEREKEDRLLKLKEMLTKAQINKLGKEGTNKMDSFMTKEELKSSLREKERIGTENRKISTELSSSTDKMKDALEKLQKARNFVVENKLNTGPNLGQYGYRLSPAHQEQQNLLKEIQFDKIVSMFAGMSKAIDSERDMASFEQAQASNSNLWENNQKILDRQIEAVKKSIEKSQKGIDLYRNTGFFPKQDMLVKKYGTEDAVKYYMDNYPQEQTSEIPSKESNKFPKTIFKDGHSAQVSNEQELKEAMEEGWS